jgi:hypothetical protein
LFFIIHLYSSITRLSSRNNSPAIFSIPAWFPQPSSGLSKGCFGASLLLGEINFFSIAANALSRAFPLIVAPLLNHPEYAVTLIFSDTAPLFPVKRRSFADFHLRGTVVLLMPVASESSFS